MVVVGAAVGEKDGPVNCCRGIAAIGCAEIDSAADSY